jgi:hypothetical protein
MGNGFFFGFSATMEYDALGRLIRISRRYNGAPRTTRHKRGGSGVNRQHAGIHP